MREVKGKEDIVRVLGECGFGDYAFVAFVW